MPKVSRLVRASQRETSVGRFLQRSTAFPAQVRKVSFEDTSSSSGSTSSSSSVVDESNIQTSCCNNSMSASSETSSPCPHGVELANRDRDQVSNSLNTDSTTASPLHRSVAYKSLHEPQLLQQDRTKGLLRRPTTSFCLSELGSSSQCEQDFSLSPCRTGTSPPRASCASSPWGHFVDVVPMDGADCIGQSFSGPSPSEPDNWEKAYFHPDTLLFWSQCSSNRISSRKSSRFEPYTKSNPRLHRKSLSPTSPEAFSNDFMLSHSYFSYEHHDTSVTRTMNLTHEVVKTMENLHF